MTTAAEQLVELEELDRLQTKAQAAEHEKALGRAYAGDWAHGGDVKDMSAFTRGLGSAKSAWDRGALGVKGLVTDLSPEDKTQLEQGRAFDRQSGFAGGVGGAGADLLMTAPVGGVFTQALGKLAAPVVARGLPGVAALLRGGGEIAGGAAQGAVMSPDERGTGAVSGGFGSALGSLANRAAGGLIKPFLRPEAEALMEQGVQPTAGQGLGGMWNVLEQRLQNTPWIGGKIKAARDRAIDDVNVAAVRNASPEAAAALKAQGREGFGDEAVKEALDSIQGQYHQALGMLPPKINIEHTPIIDAALQAGGNLPLSKQKDFYNYVESKLLMRPGEMTPELAKQIESDLGKEARRYRFANDGDQQAYGEALGAMHQTWRDSLTATADAVNPKAAALLRDADAKYRAFDPLDRAAAYAASQNAETAGRFTPRVFRQALAKGDATKNDRALRFTDAAGGTPYDSQVQLSRAARILNPTVGDPGTAGALLAAGTTGGLGALYATGHGDEAESAMVTGLAMGLGAGMGGSRFGQRALMQGLQPLAKALVDKGVVPEQAMKMIRQYGPDALMAMVRSKALPNGPAAQQPLPE